MKERAESEDVSPTAYATGYFWYRHGLSHQGLLFDAGRPMDRRFRLLIRILKLGGVHFDALMLARHKGIDAILTRHVESGTVTQVIELAAGLSPRGWRFKKKYGDKITYVETDLPKMAAVKERQLQKARLLTPGHRVVTVNALKDEGPDSLAQLAKTLDPKQGLAIITEGLMSYLDPATAQGVWRRVSATLKRFPHGVYLSDSYVRSDRYGLAGQLFRGLIQRYVRGKMHVHFETPAMANQILLAAGFKTVTLHEPQNIPETQAEARMRGGNRVRVLEAQV